MLLHSIIIGLILYILMVFVFKQKETVAENRSILIAALILIYMILFGHGIPDKLNSNL
jgi:putative effector of murein hydrolase